MCHSLVTCSHETYQAWSYPPFCSQTWCAGKAPVSARIYFDHVNIKRSNWFEHLHLAFHLSGKLYPLDKMKIVIFQPAKLNYQRVAFEVFDVGTVRLTLHEQIERPELTDLAFQQRRSMENKHPQSFYPF